MTNVVSLSDKKNFHLGHLMLECFRANPDHINQVNAATGEQETNSSVLRRTIRLSKCFRKLGLKPGDVLALDGKVHLDFYIPFCAALMCGLPIAAMDPFNKFDEIKKAYQRLSPKIAFCQNETLEDTQRAVKELQLDTMIVNFDEGELSLSKLLEKCEDEDEENFEPTDYDGDKIFAWLVSTSGTTGVPKFAAIHHGPILKILFAFRSRNLNNNYRGTCSLALTPPHWISSYFNSTNMPIIGTTRIISSAATTTEHVIDVINQYKPVIALLPPATIALILSHPKKCDLTCLKQLLLTGSKIRNELMKEVRARVSNGVVTELYGQTETLGTVLQPSPEGPLGNCGKPLPMPLTKLVNPDTEEEITEPHVPGEMLVKGFRFTEYYQMPEETSNAITPDGWFKTGDLLYRDENNYYFFVDRLKMLIKYKNFHIVPTELEEVIQRLEGVENVAVTSVPHEAFGELPVACVVRTPGSNLTAQLVKDIVAEKLTDTKQLRGGVIFLDEIPLTSTGKIARAKLRDLARTAIKE